MSPGDPLERTQAFTEEHVRAMTGALGLPVTPEDLAEVTHRLNAFVHALTPLGELPSGGVEPVPAPVDPDRAA